METRERALQILRDDRETLLGLIERLPRRAAAEPGLGGGTWSPKDLVGHLESWEEHTLEAMDAWAHGRRARIDVELYAKSLTAVNAAEVARKASRSTAAMLASAARTHRRLVDAIEGLTDAAWNAPAASRARKPLGHRLGTILIGRGDRHFAHDAAHLPDLEAFAAGHTR